jgi:integrase
MFNLAMKWGKDESNPVKEVKFFREEIDSFRYLSVKEINLLLQKATGHLKPILITAINTGMRKSEILNLRWDQIDFQHGVITVQYTKSNDIRKIPMNKRLKDTL